jgi:hypothetical protein
LPFLLLPSRIANLPLDFFEGGIFMRYTVTTFKVRLEVCDVGERSGEADDVEITKRLKECGEMLGIQGARVARFWEGRTK